MKARIAVLEGQVARLEASAAERVVILREITRAEAKSEIIDLFAAGETWYYSDVSERLGIDLEKRSWQSAGS